ncbi:MAG: endonuclease MutS2 [Oscillospiraceae bacterium]|nr:endonuclease MutS2 [Oscillospiraceae bacterium]
MMTLYEKSMQTLELNEVLAKLAEHAQSARGKERCLSLRPETDAVEIRLLLEQTATANHMVTLKGTPSFSGAVDAAAILERADRGGCLSMKELLQLARLLRAIRQAKEYGEGEGDPGILSGYFELLSPNAYLEKKITDAILSEDEMSDAASPELADIRRHIRQQSAKIRESLQKIITSPAYAKILREPIITMRADRFVVPIKSECKNEIQGLVHDVSASGGTFFIEPIQAVNANNALKELMTEEQNEIARILAMFSAEAAAYREKITESYDALVELDCIFARAKLAFAMNASRPVIRTDGVIFLKNARHPLIDSEKVVPITIGLGDSYDSLIITGPNTGGKTVSLKTLGLLTLMAECGLHIPADDGSCVSICASILADIGDEQSIDQSLSTFSAHMKNIVEITQTCDENTLVLLDELGAGTDPAEGAALAVALIEHCRARGAHVAATTHYAELKIYAMQTDGVSNACCEFDVDTLRPTYRLLIGVPGKSNAFAISKRLGLSDVIVDHAKSLVSGSEVHFEEALDRLEQQRVQMEKAAQEAESLRLEAKKQQERSESYYQQILREREKAEQNAKREAQRIIDDARREADAVREELKQLRKQAQSGVDVFESNERQAQLRKKLNEAADKLHVPAAVKERSKPSREVRVGDLVELLKFGTRAKVLSVQKDGTFELQAGSMKLTAKKNEIYLLEKESNQVSRKPAPAAPRELRRAADSELDIRGMAADEAIPVLDQFLDQAILSSLVTVRIIHGKGTGVLRKAVQEHLRRCKHVKGFRIGVYGEGENGVTIAELK